MKNPYAKRRTPAEAPESLKKDKDPQTSSDEQLKIGSASLCGSVASALIVAATDKAGMEGIDRKKIDAIILRESGNSLYMQQQRKRDQQVDQRIEQLRSKLKEEERRNPKWKTQLQNRVDGEVGEIISKRPIRSACVVVDMDMFYMACELLTRPELVDKPACVGHSMITTSNYVARRYGVRSAMAGYIGDRLVEELSGGKEKLIHVDHNFDLYKRKSMIVRRVLAEYDPNLRAYSLDEAFMDLAPYLALKMTNTDWSHERIRQELEKRHERDTNKESKSETTDGEDRLWSGSLIVLSSFPAPSCMRQASVVIAEMRSRVCKETGGLTCSAGLAPNFLLAKIASDRNKPNGQYLVDSVHNSIIEFLHPLPTRKVFGIGRVSEKMLQAFGIETVKDLYTERALVRFLFKPVTAGSLLRASVGCSPSDDKASDDDNRNSQQQGQKGISRERTFRSGLSWSEINSKLEDIGHLLASDMEKKNIWARTITVKVKLHTFDVCSRARSMSRGVYLQKASDLVTRATEILREIRGEFKGSQFSVRLLGIRCSNFRCEEVAQTNMEKFLEPSPFSGRFSCKLAESGTDADCAISKARTSQTSTPVKGASALPQTFAAAALRVRTQSSVNPTNDNHRKTDARKEPLPVVAEPTLSCPICERPFRESQNDELNQHIDTCLSGPEVRNIIREQRDLEAADFLACGRKKQRRTITDFW